jgi:transcriptional regulator of acetoin/glycerol metabolism
VAARVDRVVALYRHTREIETEYKRKLAALAAPDGHDVPVAHLAERLGVERKTVYRHLGRSMA